MLETIASDLKTAKIDPPTLGVIRTLVFGTERGMAEALPCFRRWFRQQMTPYRFLPEKEKESDREEARKKVTAYQGAWRQEDGRKACPVCGRRIRVRSNGQLYKHKDASKREWCKGAVP
jgi:hypothetical protein